MATAAGIRLTWDDFADLSEVVPLLARVYPNGSADVNQFHAAGGMQYLIRELLGAGCCIEDVKTVWGTGLDGYLQEPKLAADGTVTWEDGASASRDESVLRPAANPFSAEGGLKLLDGNLGRAVIKVSAVKPEHQVVEAPALIFHSQEELPEAFRAGQLERDFVAVVRFQGPKANGMPELHKLTPTLGILQDRGYKVALVTDGRMSGASGKVPAAIHVTPEASDGRRRSRRSATATSSASIRRAVDCRCSSTMSNSPRARQRPPTFRRTTTAWGASCSVCSGRTPSRRNWGPGCCRGR